MFPLPRILYAMSQDGILYKVLQRVHPKTKTPVISTMLSGLVAAIMALIFNLHQLIDMMSIGTLLAYTIVAICVLVLRYQDDINSSVKELEVTKVQLLRQIVNANSVKRPSNLSSNIAKISICIYCFATVVLCCLLEVIDISSAAWWAIVIVNLAILTLLMLVIWRQPHSEVELTFKVPLVPLIPCLSVIINLYLMFQLDINTWIRFIVWIIIGYVIYFSYGIRHSIEGDKAARGLIAANAHSTQNVKVDFVNLSTYKQKQIT